MSLNGLDASAVVEAHQAALADPGGWFLLKYVNRDTVELLSKGTGGVFATKNVIEQYEEKSPLYGLIHFRRKRVLLKYVPVGTSRLLQVRLTVQFQSVADAFPQDTIFSFTAPAEFSEAALSLSVMLQPSTHGTSLASSAASIKHRRLDEISEDAEDAAPTSRQEVTTPTASAATPGPTVEQTPTHSIQTSYDGLPPSALRAKALLARRKEAELASNAESVPSHTRGADSLTLTVRSAQLSSLDKSLPATPEAEPTPPPSRYGFIKSQEGTATPPVPPKSELRADSRQAQYHKHIESTSEADNEPKVSFDQIAQQIHHSNHLSPNESKSISQWNEQVTAYTTTIKPKKKLAPRPHIESTFRPKTSNTVGMPNTVRASSRQGATTPVVAYRPSSQQSSRSVPGRFTQDRGPVPPLPTSQVPPLYQIPDSRPAPSVASSHMTESAIASPEKLRLMKALQKRKRNQLLAQRSATSLSSRAQTSLGERPELENQRADLNQEPRPKSEIPSTPPLSQVVPTSTTVNLIREHDSSTASPVSITTASGTQSTKPSSFSGEVDRKNSPRSSSINTESSATPKASQDKDQSRSAQSPAESAESPDHASSVGTATAKTHVPKSSVDEALDRLTGATEQEIPQTVVSQPSPTRENKDAKDVATTQEPRLLNAGGLKFPPRTSSHGALLGAGRNSKHLTLQSIAGRSSAYNSIYSDDSLMEEIQNATLHEAMPVSVPRTPATPMVRKLSSDMIREITKAPTGDDVADPKTAPVDKQKPRSASMKSSSTAPHTMTSDEPLPPLTNKSTLGTSISKRIKALEVLTHRESIHGPPAEARESSGTKSAFSNLINRTSFIAQFQASKQTSDDQSPQKNTIEPPRTATGVREIDLNARPLVQRQGEATELFAPSRKGETVSVTARIVREQRRPATSATVRNHENGLGLHRSPLIVEHARNPSDPASMSFMSRDISGQSINTYSTVTEKPRVSFSSFRTNSTVRHILGDGRSSRMSFMSKKSSRAPSEVSSIADEKKSNRAGRLMKRMSGLGSRFGPKGSKFGASKDHLPQQETILEQVEDDRRQSMTESLLQMIDIGDVNVQFPETLLWKRRFMRIDDQGYLMFTAPTDNVHIRTTSRKFHLAELKTPTLPDREREEMAWSIILDLRDGTSIQCACGSKSAQADILKMLVDAHYAYNSLYTAP